ncbi:hypothetical protein [Kitasatospora purpeofusca]|uniref:hypothetical protein n=1 Tax=Kitasatospora purpeofusca TaxID=67352 RepID=UPI00225A60C1|nr:hypothetical protein [Kitasatospora purpeofusca]MCX4757265.1 hypothetical protein [Kitasatospora purpeofusca]WSR34986.1 hypothetical protein OG715_30930 [Kitasatospora purpeofusca]WSR43205.1 hypothetical protein OG196_31440 [Kitasatospora purpeofusca]
MLPKTVRGAVAAAAVLVEEVGKRVVGTAAGLLEKGGIDVTEVERRFGGQFPPSAQSLQTLAEEAVTAGRAGVDLAVGVARGEVEKVFEKVGDQVTKVGVVLAYLESKLREVEEEDEGAPSEQAGSPPAPRAGGLFEDGWEQETRGSAGAERIVVDEPVEVDPPVPPNGTAVAAQALSEKATEKTAEKAAERTVAKKAAAPKPDAAKKAAPAAKKAAAKKTAVKKTAVKKTSTAKRATAAKKPAEAGSEQPPAKRTATRKTTVRRTSTTKKPDA